MKPKQFAVQFGKVRINTAVSATERVLTATSRISAFDCVLPFEVENKGQILQAISTHFFNITRDIVPNHLIGCLDSHSMLVKSGRVLPLEVIVRATLSGSLWRAYQFGGPKDVERQFGISLPAGLTQHARFAEPLVTFTTKAAFGHDEVVTASAAVEHVFKWLKSEKSQPGTQRTSTDSKTENESKKTFVRDLVDNVQRTAVKLFERGQECAQKADLLLLDTKYEFALDENNQLMLVDEIHTPDASRYVDLELFQRGHIEHLSKEWLREIIQSEVAAFEKTASEEDKNRPFILRPFWDKAELKEKLARGLAQQYKTLFSRLFPQQTPWDLISPHLIPWPVDPNAMRQAENQQRLPSRILVVGNGGRDFTIAHFVEKAAEVDIVYCWPGRSSWNGDKRASLNHLSAEELISFCQKEKIGWAIFGPEIPIAQGLAEKLREKNIPCLAPDLKGAMLESSKIYTKEVLKKAGCPTAESWTLGWNELKSCEASSQTHQNSISGTHNAGATTPGNSGRHAILDEYPYVLKYESLAAGKGVCLVFNAQERSAAIAHFEENLPQWLRELSSLSVDTYTRRNAEPQFLIEKLLPGKEISAIALCHGENFVLLPYAQDYKRRNDSQQGPNTGGMGAVCPVALPSQLDEQIRSVFRKTLQTLNSEGKPYSGFLFAGLMVDEDSAAHVLEFNCRLGDPETQVILPGLGRDLLLNMWLTSTNSSWSLNPWHAKTDGAQSLLHDGLQRCFVVVASPEYPDRSAPKRTLSLPEQWPLGCQWIPAGVDNANTTSAGRIGGVLCAGENADAAVRGAYQGVAQIAFTAPDAGKIDVPHYRKDVQFPRLTEERISP